ncbi:MAG: endolytic transglycosylase MltG [Deltaproteobacteria bacterium]|nr:endolytic transglycosylase MltG [Deltaproteobacteria bacterium]
MARRRSRALIWLALALVAGCAVGYGGLVHLWGELPRAGSGREIAIDVPRGTGPHALSRLLASHGVVDSAWLFELYVRVRRASPRIRAGRYLLGDDLSPSQVLGRIARVGAGGALRVTIPEGMNLFRIAELLQREGVVAAPAFLEAARDPLLLAELRVSGESAEGYLFPDTYDLLPGSRAESVVRRLKSNFDRRVAPVFATEAARVAALGQIARLDERGVVVIASLVEAETRLPAERPRVAAVFLNRLSAAGFVPRYLSSDPAVAYGCQVAPSLAPSCARATGRPGDITRAMLDDRKNLYNTYRHAGPPPGPVCNPGLEAIRAVLHPAETEDLYFVARGDGSHAFARTLPEHNQNVRRYR